MPTEYARFHSERLHALDDAVLRACWLVSSVDMSELSALEVGPSDWASSSRVFRKFGRRAVLGLDVSNRETHGGHLSLDCTSTLPAERHVVDLNSPIDSENIDPFDVIVFAETLEHLRKPAHVVLSGLKKLLTENGVIVLQTPNFARIANRIKLLLGKNPQEYLRDNDANPGHFREHTLSEIVVACGLAGLEVRELIMSNYFTSRQPQRWMQDRLPPSMRDGMTMILSQTAEPST